MRSADQILLIIKVCLYMAVRTEREAPEPPHPPLCPILHAPPDFPGLQAQLACKCPNSAGRQAATSSPVPQGQDSDFLTVVGTGRLCHVE